MKPFPPSSWRLSRVATMSRGPQSRAVHECINRFISHFQATKERRADKANGQGKSRFPDMQRDSAPRTSCNYLPRTVQSWLPLAEHKLLAHHTSASIEAKYQFVSTVYVDRAVYVGQGWRWADTTGNSGIGSQPLAHGAKVTDHHPLGLFRETHK